MTDPIADMLTRIRNALTVHKDTVEVPSSKMKAAIAQIMLEEGYLKGVELVEDGFNGKLVLTLKYTDDNRSVINGLSTASSFSRSNTRTTTARSSTASSVFPSPVSERTAAHRPCPRCWAGSASPSSPPTRAS